MAGVDLQVVWNENKGAVQMFIGDFRIDLPPVLCEQLEKELAAARRVPERARAMVEGKSKPQFSTFGDAPSVYK